MANATYNEKNGSFTYEDGTRTLILDRQAMLCLSSAYDRQCQKEDLEWVLENDFGLNEQQIKTIMSDTATVDMILDDFDDREDIGAWRGIMQDSINECIPELIDGKLSEPEPKKPDIERD